ncbi:MAG: RHS repeat-associated core domain-containing protein, partial [Thermonemataceae bacterium]
KGNQLINVTDATNDLDRDKSLGDFRDGNKKANTGLDDYLYDPNGNLLLDHNKNISAITYNHLNLPEQILFGEDGQNYLRFVYDAAGVKLRQEVWQEGQLEKWTDYEGSFIYEQGKLAFFHTAEGRAVAQYLPQGEGTQPTFAYEYIIKDHLGNNRVSFREGETETYLATMDGADNEGGFHNIAETRASLTGHSSQVSKTDATQPEGLWKVLPVSKGDTIQVAVDARYLVEASEQRNNVDINPIVQNTGSGSDNAADNGDTTPEWVLGVSLTPNPQSEDSGVPQAYVQYLLYDETGEVLQSSGQVAISDQAKDGWETLTLEYIAEENGVLQVLALNNSDVEVYFENFQIEYAPTLIAQEQHFYPYGLTMQGLGKQGIPQHRFTYNGKEEVNDFNLGWIDYGWRNMDRALGRWWSIDNKAEKYISLSTYHYAGNNPTRFFDIDGNEFTEDAWAHVNRLIAEVDRKQQNNNNGIAERQALLDAGGLSDRKAGRLQRQINRLEGRNAQLEEVRTGVAELAASSQVYDIQENASLRQTGVVQGAGSVTGKAGFNHSNGNFVIEIPTQSPLHIIAHELQHAHQFENGRYSVGPTLGNNAHRNFLYDQHDELEAYNEWGSLFGGRTFGNINSLPEHYRQYATGPVDVNIFQMTQVILNSDEPEETKQIMLQRIAENTRHAFRVNGQTYYEQR